MQRTDRVIVAAICAMGLVAVFSHADPEAITERLKRYDETYVRELAKIEADARQSRATLDKQYVDSLQRLFTTLQQAGKLDPLLAVKREQDRFQQAKTVEEGDCVGGSGDLETLQRQYVAASAKLGLNRAQSVMDLFGKFDASLERLQTSLTKEGALDDALAVKEKRDGVRASAEVTAAQFVLAEQAAQPAPEKTPEVAPVAPATTTPPARPTLHSRDAVRRDAQEAKKRIKARYEGFCEALGDGNLDAATAFINPEVVRNAGVIAIKPFLVPLSEILKGAKKAGVDIDVGRIQVSDDGMAATNYPRVRYANAWHDTDPTGWMRVEDEWYVKVGK